MGVIPSPQNWTRSKPMGFKYARTASIFAGERDNAQSTELDPDFHKTLVTNGKYSVRIPKTIQLVQGAEPRGHIVESNNKKIE